MGQQYTSDIQQEESDVIDSIYKAEEEYKEELSKEKPDNDKLLKLMLKQWSRGLALQMYQQG